MNKILIIIVLLLAGVAGHPRHLPKEQRKVIEKLMTDGAYAQALYMLENTLPDYKTDPELLFLKGICYYQLDSLKQCSVTVLEEALFRNENTQTELNILYHLAQAYSINNYYAQAVNTYKNLLEKIPATHKNLHQKIERKITYCEQQLRQQHNAENTTPVQITPTSLVVTEPTDSLSRQTKQYTIQICTMKFPLSDSFFKGKYGVKLIRMGDLYRYIYSVYYSLQEAQNDLSKIRKIYPDAFIREFDENKLGKAIDLNIDNLK